MGMIIIEDKVVELEQYITLAQNELIEKAREWNIYSGNMVDIINQFPS